jgi:hypothetical protein
MKNKYPTIHLSTSIVSTIDWERTAEFPRRQYRHLDFRKTGSHSFAGRSNLLELYLRTSFILVFISETLFIFFVERGHRPGWECSRSPPPPKLLVSLEPDFHSDLSTPLLGHPHSHHLLHDPWGSRHSTRSCFRTLEKGNHCFHHATRSLWLTIDSFTLLSQNPVHFSKLVSGGKSL